MTRYFYWWTGHVTLCVTSDAKCKPPKKSMTFLRHTSISTLWQTTFLTIWMPQWGSWLVRSHSVFKSSLFSVGRDSAVIFLWDPTLADFFFFQPEKMPPNAYRLSLLLFCKPWRWLCEKNRIRSAVSDSEPPVEQRRPCHIQSHFNLLQSDARGELLAGRRDPSLNALRVASTWLANHV